MSPEAEIASIKTELTNLRSDFGHLHDDVKELVAISNRQAGGFKVAMTIASIIGAFIGWFASNWPFK